jgi:hypothetical protein
MWGNLTYEVVGQCRRLKKIVAKKINVILFFDRIVYTFFPSST